MLVARWIGVDLMAVPGLFNPMFILVAGIEGPDYFVDATSGSDANDGLSAGAPWQTLNKVNISSFSAGGVIAFKRGEEWRETLTPPSSGSSGLPITFTAYGTGADPIINGADYITGWTNTSGDVWEAAASDQVRNVFLNGTKQLQGVEGATDNDYASTTDDGSTITESIASVEAAGDGAWWWDDSANKLYIHNSSGVDPGDVNVEGGIRTYCVDINSKNYATVENIEGKYADTAIFDIRGSSDNCILDNVTGSFAYFSGIHLSGTSTNSIVINSTVFSNGRLLDSGNSSAANNGHGINISTTGSVTLVTLNESYDNAEDGCQVNSGATTSYVITFNDWHDNHEDGQDIKEGDITNSFVTDNHIHGNHIRGLQIIGSTIGLNAPRNTIHNNGSVGIWVAGNGGTYKFHSDLIYLNGDPTKDYTSTEFHGIRLEPTASFTSVEIYNCTIFSSATGGECIEFVNINADNVDVKNNILEVITVTTEEAFKVQNTVTGTVEQNNLVRNAHATGNNVVRIFGTGYDRSDINDGSYTSATGLGTNTVDADPDFVNAPSDDYRLNAASAAVGAGATGLGVTTDVNGDTYASPPNMGCFAGSV